MVDPRSPKAQLLRSPFVTFWFLFFLYLCFVQRFAPEGAGGGPAAVLGARPGAHAPQSPAAALMAAGPAPTAGMAAGV
jgi:hypothetical protein